MSVEDLITIIGMLMGIAGVAIAAWSLLHTRDINKTSETKENVQVHADLQNQITEIQTTMNTKLESIDDGVRDLKAENRSFRQDLSSIKDTLREEMRSMKDDIHDEIKDTNEKAVKAMDLAEAAHRRLDRIGAPEDTGVTKKVM